MGGYEAGPIRQEAFRAFRRAELPIVHTVVSHDQLREAMGRHRQASTLKLGARLLELELITEDQLSQALALQSREPVRHLGHILVDLGCLSSEELHQVLCEQLGIPVIRISDFGIDRDVRRLLPEELILECRAIPLCRMDGKLVVAVSDPLDLRALERVRFYAQAPVTPVMAAREDIDQAIRIHYSPAAEIPYPRLAPSSATRDGDDMLAGENAPRNELEASVARLIRKMIADAHSSGASDIHVECGARADQLTIRFRQHGQLHDYLQVPTHLRRGVVARIKLLAGLESTVKGVAQEGRIETRECGVDLQLRVVAVPTVAGNEHIAMKLTALRELPPLDTLGLGSAQLDVVKQLLSRPSGLLVVAGPTGSGKTTTAHAVLSLLNLPGLKIWSAESPIETRRSGWSQVQVNEAVAWDYPAVMRAILSADPDVILVGDLRDRDTAALVVEAALRGSRVIAALQSRSAADTLARLLELGVNTFSLSDALLGIVSQRLARRLCSACRLSRPLSSPDLASLALEFCDGTALSPLRVRTDWIDRYGDQPNLYDASGCELCAGAGHEGRVGLFEVLQASPALRRMIRQRRSLDDMFRTAVEEGMRTLRQDGIEKALAGHCSLLEVRAATV